MPKTKYIAIGLVIVAVAVVLVIYTKRKREQAALSEAVSPGGKSAGGSAKGKGSVVNGKWTGGRSDSFPLKQGSYGPRVLMIQQEINQRNGNVKLDGKWGPETEKHARRILGAIWKMNGPLEITKLQFTKHFAE